MNNSKWLLLTFMIFITACKNEDIQPHLDINGHWLVDHGLYDDCQVSATFTEKLLLVSVYSLEDGACRPELYGIENNALAIQIDNKEDYFNDAGVLTTELQVSVPSRQAFGTLVLTQTSSGLEGSIVAASDPRGLLEPLLEPTYLLSRVSENWVPFALGTWGTKCNPAGADFLCLGLQFKDAVSGQLSFYAHGPTGNTDAGAELEDSILNDWTEATFAIRHLTSRQGVQFEMHMVIFTTRNGTIQSLPVVLSVSEGKIVVNDDVDDAEAMIFELDRTN
jgi:hypothetical protein